MQLISLKLFKMQLQQGYCLNFSYHSHSNFKFQIHHNATPIDYFLDYSKFNPSKIILLKSFEC